VVGDGRKYLVALLLLEEEVATRYAQDHRIPFATYADLAASPEIRALLEREVATVNRSLAPPERIRRFTILPRRFYEEEGDVTPTKKVKRRNVERRYADLIADLYRD
jgi:long-chain acyl-CoA synthetase